MGALSNKGGRGHRNREEIGAGTTYFSRGFAARYRALRANFAASPLVRPALQNRHATQAIALSDKSYPEECRHSLNGSTEASRA